ncbi:MAG: cytochrome c3 family protein [Candidatus Coatesbacteria bacterium]
MKERIHALLGWLLVGLAVVGVIGWLQATPGSAQPIAFDHQKHVEGAGLECTLCHPGAREGRRAGIVAAGECMGCHADAAAESPEVKKLKAFADRGQQIPWVQVYKAPPDDSNMFFRPNAVRINFSHQRHVEAGAVDCAACHGAVGHRSKPVTSPELPIRMRRCLECHRARKITTDCLACHR